MNHFMLPDASEGGMLSSSARYGAYAMEVLLNHLLKLGARRSSLEAKVFGGGTGAASLTQTQVGEKNAQFLVLDYLRTERIPVVAQDLLDIYPRKAFDIFPVNGRVMMKKPFCVKNDTPSSVSANIKPGFDATMCRVTSNSLVDRGRKPRSGPEAEHGNQGSHVDDPL